MIRAIRRNVLRVRYPYTNDIDIQRAQVLLFLLLALIVFTAFWFLLQVIPNLVPSSPFIQQLTLASGLTGIAAVISAILLQTGALRAASLSIIGGMTAAMAVVILGLPDSPTDVSGTFMVALLLPMIMAGLLLSWRGMALIAGLLVVIVIFGALGQLDSTTPLVEVPAELAAQDALIAFSGIFLTLFFMLTFAGSLERTSRRALGDMAQQRWVSRLSASMEGELNERAMLDYVLNELRGYYLDYRFSLYLRDDDGSLKQGTDLRLSSRTLSTFDGSALAQAARSGQIQRVDRTVAAALRAYLPASAKAALALPLVESGQTLAVLDVQSDEPFPENAILALEAIAASAAVALRHRRRLADLRMELADSTVAMDRLQTRLERLQAESRGDVGTTWNRYLQGRGAPSLGFDLAGMGEIVQAEDLPEGLHQALASGALHVESLADEQVVSIPIRFRDINLGAMSFAVPAGQPLTRRQIDMASAVAERLAVALENTRLFEQSQAQATREQKASAVSTLLIQATTVPAVLKLASEQFKEALGAVHTRIVVQPEAFARLTAAPAEEAVR